jgi:hypothetical protein
MCDRAGPPIITHIIWFDPYRGENQPGRERQAVSGVSKTESVQGQKT